TGQVAEMQLANAFRSRKRFRAQEYFKGVPDEHNTLLNIIDVKTRFIFQREDGKNMEFDVVAESKCGRTLIVEVKKRAVKTGVNLVEDFIEKVESYRKVESYQKADIDRVVLPAFLSLGGFTHDALELCGAKGIFTSDKIEIF
ncbi:MAG: hypothetical protein HQK66_02680, partial [Desulfamplus sp.]|nr:hypothetical protein [Desulfamplus sp.]